MFFPDREPFSFSITASSFFDDASFLPFDPDSLQLTFGHPFYEEATFFTTQQYHYQRGVLRWENGHFQAVKYCLERRSKQN